MSQTWQETKTRLIKARRVLARRAPGRIQFWFLALFVGIGAGLAALLFRFGISFIQTTVYGTDDVGNLHSLAQTLEWYWILIIPILGGLTVGVILDRFTPDGRVRSVADAIEGAALNDGRVERREGLASAAASMITLSTGGSTGREGPVVHLAGVVSSKICKFFNADGVTGRELLGCAVAGAVAASFNAPIAGAIFALEVILRHFAIHAFAPIAIASVAGTVVGRLAFGDVTEFTLVKGTELAFYFELPAFLILGLVCGVVAVIFMRSIFIADNFASKVQERTAMPRWLRPGISGAMLGLIAIWFPHIIGVGYETTSAALTGQLDFRTLVVFAIIKCAAVAITMAGRMGGGVFSPALMMGALTGLACGLLATSLLPAMSGGPTLFALAGMGAVAAAVLGAPISTTLIVFELTGDWQTGLAVMVAVSTSSAVSAQFVDKSFFLTQLEKLGIHLAAGPQAYVLATVFAMQLMRPKSELTEDQIAACEKLMKQQVFVDQNANLENILPIFEKSNIPMIPVTSDYVDGDAPCLEGCVFHVDALKAYSKAMAAIAKEEHG
ncbi:MAG: chloride channel protein [Planktomarina sp.]